MNEVITEALILQRSLRREHDGEVVCFTKDLGKIRARAVGLYKATSRLSGHLQPGMLTKLRLVQRKGFHIVDALQEEQTERHQRYASVLGLIAALTHEEEPDLALWEAVAEKTLTPRKALSILGFDPAHARCTLCKRVPVRHFILRDTTYACANCYKKLQKTHKQDFAGSIFQDIV